jgi:crotonobetainyl-CoA:carnitine CoA-transferase CaiB-like acyl-CoA transferase
MLKQLRVAEISTDLPTQAAGAVLRDLGAQVTRVILGDKPPREPKIGRHERLLNTLLAADKGSSPIGCFDSDELVRAVSGFDIVLAGQDLVARFDGHEDGKTARYMDFVRQNNRGVWVTITPFGLEGPNGGIAGDEITTIAVSGIGQYMRNSSGRPMKPAGFGSSQIAGHFGAMAALYGIARGRFKSDAVHLDVSGQESSLVTGVFLECAHELFDCPGRGGDSRYAPPRGLLKTRDGYIWLTILEDHQWRGLTQALGSPDWARGIVTASDRERNAEMVVSKVSEWIGAHGSVECESLFQARGVPATAVSTALDLLSDQDLHARGFFRRLGDTDNVPGLPVAFHERTGNSANATRAQTGRWERVLDLTTVLAGPLATSWLGTMGFDVVKVEDPSRIDVYRRRGPFADGRVGPESSAYFASCNYSKKSYALDTSAPGAANRIAELLEASDVVIDNSSEHRARRLGTHLEDFRAKDSVLVSLTGFGRTTSRSAYRAYGQNIHASGGLIHLSRDRAGNPTNVGTSWADPVSAIWLATLTLAQVLTPPPERSNLDLSMVEVVARNFSEFLVSASEGADRPAYESRRDGYAPHGFYRCAGPDDWLAISVADDDAWRSLKQALGNPAELDLARFDTHAQREANQDDLELALDRVLSAYDRDTAWRMISRAGVTAAPVRRAEELTSDKHLAARGFFQSVHHPVWGRKRLAGLPWLIAGEGRLPLAPTPRLGEHSALIDESWLGKPLDGPLR